MTMWFLNVNPAVSFGQDKDEVDLFFQKNMEHTPFLVVMLSADYDGVPEFGAGIVFGREKDKIFIATASHVVRRGNVKPQSISVRFKQYPDKIFSPVVVKSGGEGGLDLAVLSIDNVSKQGINACTFPFGHLGTTDDLERGDLVYALGNPNGVAWSMSIDPDKLSGLEKNELLFQSSIVGGGYSGGALIDENADIVGMTTADQPPFGRAIKMDAIIKKVKDWGFPVQLDYADEDSIPLINAVNRNDMATVKKLLAQCADPNVIDDEDGGFSTPLHYAVEDGRKAIVSLLLSAGATPNFLNDKGESPLMKAIYAKDVETTKVLLNAGADLNVMDEDGYNPLCYAIHVNSLDLVKILINAKSPVNKNYKSEVTPLRLAVLNRNADIIKLLIDAGGNVNEQDEHGESLLAYATYKADITITDLLRSHGAKQGAKEKVDNFPRIAQAIQSNNLAVVKQSIINGEKAEPNMLYEPIWAENVEMIKLLAKATNNINERLRQSGETLLHLAVYKKNLEIIKLLVENGANVNMPGYRQQTPLFYALINHPDDNNPIADFLVTHGANVKGTDPTLRDKFLLEAAKSHRLTAVKYLLQAGTNPNGVGKEYSGKTPLQLAILAEDVAIVRELIKAGANVNEALSDDPPIVLAIKKNNTTIVKILTDAHADINNRGQVGSSIPLEEAIEKGNINMVNTLLNTNIAKENLEKALETAVKKGSFDIFSAILKKDMIPANFEHLFELAVEGKNLNIVDALLKINSHPKNFDKLFERLIYDNRVDMAALFLAKGAKPSLVWSDILKDGKVPFIELFLKNRVNVNEELDNGEYPLHVAVENDKLEVVKLLLAAGARFDAKGNGFVSCFEEAVNRGNMAISKLLLEKGANINEINAEGEQPLHIAVSNTDGAEMVKWLLMMKANVNGRDKYGATPLHNAVRTGNREIVSILLKASANINLKDEWGQYPIHMIYGAETKEANEVIDVLVQAGANLNVKDNEGETPLALAIKNKNDMVIKYLRAHGAK